MSVAVRDAFFDYAAANQFALFPLHAHSKVPAGKWTLIASRDPADWLAWRTEGYMLGISAFASRVILIDVDIKIGRDEAYQYFSDWCQSLGFDAPAPYCQSRSGGWHFAFQVPENFDADANRGTLSIGVSRFRPLLQDEKDCEVISVRNRGYCVAPGSVFKGGEYQLFPNAPAPHPWQPALGKLLEVPDIVVANGNGAVAAGSVDPALIRIVLEWMRDNDCFQSDDNWRELGMILRGEYGDDIGLDLFAVARNGESMNSQGMVRWNSFNLPHQVTPRDSKIGTLIKKAKDAGCPYKFPPPPARTTEQMFGGVAAIAAAAGATTHSQAQGAALVGQTWGIQGVLGQPLLDRFLDGTKDLPTHPESNAPYPQLPDSMATHPLFDLLNESISRIVVMTETPKTFRQQRVWDVMKVLNCVHEPIYNDLVSFILVRGCTLSLGELAKHNKGFEVAIRMEGKADKGPRGFVPGAKNLPDAQISDNVGIFLGMAGARLQYDEFTKRCELAESEESPFTRVDQHHLDKLWYLAKSSAYNFHPSKDLFRTGFGVEARAAKSYDSLCDRVDALALAWDGVARLDTWLTRCVGVADDLYHQTVGRNLIGGMVRRARYPGCVQAETVIFISPQQGTGKSSLCRILALESDWYLGKYKIGGSEQNSLPLLAGKWIVEMSELAGLNKTDFEDVKSLLTSTKDEYVAKYEAIPTEHLRRCCFIGTSNLRQPLADPSGNRRFLPVNVVGAIDLVWLQNNVEQLIGEAAARDTLNESFAIPEAVWALTAAQQEAARNLSPIEEAILEWFDRPEPELYVLKSDVRRALAMAGLHATARYSVFMENLGWRDVQAPNRARDRVWMKGTRFSDCIGLAPAQLQVNGRVEMRMQAQQVLPTSPGMPLPPTGPVAPHPY